MTTKKLEKFFEEHGFNVRLSKEDGKQCAEIEIWTDGGVDMNIQLIPFTKEEFVSYVDDFDMDDEIDLYREDERYKQAFRISESIEDFTNYLNNLKTIVTELENL